MFCLNDCDVCLILIQHKVVCLYVKVKVKVKVKSLCLIKHHAMKTYEVTGQLHAAAALPSGEEPLILIG
jgi:hypothetical protein